MEAHKVILAASSPFFDEMLQRIKHPRPLIYLRGFQSQDLLAILDFLYFAEAKVYQENINAFLEIAEELKGLADQTFTSSSSNVSEDEDKSRNLKPVRNAKKIMKPTTHNLHNALVPLEINQMGH